MGIELVEYFEYEDKKLTFHISGKLFDDGFDLFETSDSLQNLQNIFDKAYLTITEKSKVTDRDRALYKVKATEIRKGSFIADLTIYISSAMQIAIPILAHYAPTYLRDVTKEGFSYLKAVLEANKEGKQVSIENKGNDSVVLHISGDNSAPITINNNSYIFAAKSFDYFQNIARKVDGEQIKVMEILDVQQEENSIRLTKNEREIFTLETKQVEDPIRLTGRVFRIDTHTKSGKLQIITCSDATLVGREINFELQFAEDIDKCCRVIERVTEFVAYRRIVFNPIEIKDEVKSLKLVSIGI